MTWGNITLTRGADWYLKATLARADTDWETSVTWRLEIRQYKRDTTAHSAETALAIITDQTVAVSVRASDSFNVATIVSHSEYSATDVFPLGKLYADLRMDHPSLGVQYVAGWNINCVPHVTEAP